MELDLSYTVTYRDFLESVRQFRRRSRWSLFVYYFDFWILPILGLLAVATYLLGLATGNGSIVSTFGWLAAVGFACAVGLPTLYTLKLRQAYKHRIALSEGGSMRTETTDAGIRFLIQDKIDVRYEWNTFSDYSEAQSVLTLFVRKSAFHTIPKHDLSESDWAALLHVVASKVKRF